MIHFEYKRLRMNDFIAWDFSQINDEYEANQRPLFFSFRFDKKYTSKQLLSTSANGT